MKTLLTLLAIALSASCVQLQSQSLLDRAKKKAEEKLKETKKNESKKDESEKPLPPKGTQAHYEEIDRREREKAQKEADARKEQQRLASEEAQRQGGEIRARQEEENAKHREAAAERNRQNDEREEARRQEIKQEQEKRAEELKLMFALEDWNRLKQAGARATSGEVWTNPAFQVPEGLKVVINETGKEQIGDTTLYSYTYWIENTTGEQYNSVRIRFYSGEGEVGQTIMSSIVSTKGDAGQIEKLSFKAPTTVEARIVSAVSRSQYNRARVEMRDQAAVNDLSVVRFAYQDGSCSVTVKSKGAGHDKNVVTLRLDHEDGSGKFVEMSVPKGKEVTQAFPANKKVASVRIVGISYSGTGA